MTVIFYFSSQSTTGIVTEPLSRFIFFKTLHLLEYAILAILIFYAIQKNKTTIIISYLYALSDEVHQLFVPGRSGLFRDSLIDLLGIVIGIFIIKQLQKIKILPN